MENGSIFPYLVLLRWGDGEGYSQPEMVPGLSK